MPTCMESPGDIQFEEEEYGIQKGCQQKLNCTISKNISKVYFYFISTYAKTYC